MLKLRRFWRYRPLQTLVGCARIRHTPEHKGNGAVECQICQIRSAVGRCDETNQLVCEECSVACYRCGKRMATTAGHQTKSGHIYCTPCFQARAAKRAGHEAPVAQGLIPDEGPVAARGPAGTAPVAEIEEEAVLARWEPPAPWKMSLYLGLVGIALAVFFMLFPGYRSLPLTNGNYIPLGLVGLLLGAIGVVWAVIGLMSPRFVDTRTRNYVGLGIAVVAAILSLTVMQPPPMSSAEAELRGGNRPRQFQNDAERAQWRQKFLGGQRGSK